MSKRFQKVTYTSSMCPQKMCKVWRMSAKRCERTWLHKVGTLLKEDWPSQHSPFYFVQPGQKYVKSDKTPTWSVACQGKAIYQISVIAKKKSGKVKMGDKITDYEQQRVIYINQ
jgi:hypothetical protein